MINRWKIIGLTLLVSMMFGCREQDVTSDTLVTDVDHTRIKRQSIGNCWIYAQSTWLESLIKTQTGEDVNVSESYWTYWHWYNQIVGSYISEVETGGFWSESNRIIAEHGWVLESDFIPSEEDGEISYAQSTALSYINEQLQEGGSLADVADRTPENVKEALNAGFSGDIDAAVELSHSIDDTIVGENTSLRDALYGSAFQRWKQVSFAQVYGEGGTPNFFQRRRRAALMQRVLRALNDNHPVVMTLMIDFNALDITDQTFKASTLRDSGALGVQGGHMVVLNDYTVDNVPGYGYIGEGEVSDEMKQAALQGDIILLKAKNSWGTNRPSRGLTDGYTRFDWEYLSSPLEWKYGESDDSTSWYTTLSNFVLPPGY